MCFSETASLVAGGALCSAGGVAVWKAGYSRDLGIAMIPMIFGVQQIAEGFVWHDLHRGNDSLTWAVTVFTIIAYSWWPLYLPFAVRLIERGKTRRALLTVMQTIGAAVSAYLLAGLASHNIHPIIDSGHIDYQYQFPHEYKAIAVYAFVVIFAPLLSSGRYVRWLGVAIMIGAPTSYFVSKHSAESLWCFFSAVCSVVILGHIFRGERKRPTVRS